MQAEDGESLETQLHDLRAYAKKEGIKILHEYQDAGFSGKNTKDRPGFNEMVDAIKSGVRVDVILVWKLNRFGRNTLDVLSSIKELAKYGTTVYFDDRNMYSDDDMSKLLIMLLSIVAEMERENILEQTMAGRKQKAREGYWNGGQAPYGYRLEMGEDSKNHLIIKPDEADVVRLIFKKFNDGMGVNSLSGWLNDHGYRREMRGNMKFDTFNPHFVKKLLDNPVYTGVIAYGRRHNELIEGSDNEYHIVEQFDYDTFDGEHDALIDKATWERARERRAKNSTAFPRKSRFEGHENLLSGVIKCPGCGRSMIPNRRDGHVKKDGTRGKTTWSYYCRYARRVYGNICNYVRQPNQDIVHVEIIKKTSHSPVFKERLMKELDATSDIDKLKEDVERIEAAVRDNEKQRKNTVRLLSNLDPSDDTHELMFEDTKSQLTELAQAAQGLSKSLSEAYLKLEAAEQNRITSQNIYDRLGELEDGYDGKTDAEKKEIIQSIVEIDPEAKHGGPMVTHIKFKVPVSFHPLFPEEMLDVLSATEFNLILQRDYYAENSWVNGEHVDTVIMMRNYGLKGK